MKHVLEAPNKRFNKSKKMKKRFRKFQKGTYKPCQLSPMMRNIIIRDGCGIQKIHIVAEVCMHQKSPFFIFEIYSIIYLKFAELVFIIFCGFLASQNTSCFPSFFSGF